MSYINPIEILELNSKTLDEINNTVIKKAKRVLFADIELSDEGHLKYYGNKLSKNDCENSIHELDDNEKVRFYLFLYENQALNNFLANGDKEKFKLIKFDKIYKNPEFVEYISPYLTEKFGKIILESFKNHDLKLFTLAMESMPPFNQVNLNKSFNRVSNEIAGRISDLENINKHLIIENSFVKLIEQSQKHSVFYLVVCISEIEILLS